MKSSFLFFFLILSLKTFAGGFYFPNVEYEYAKLYLFNSGENAHRERPEYSVYRNGYYAVSKVGNGWTFTQEMNTKMNSIFRTGVNGMVAGMSGCYIPRHGIVYFNWDNEPVASISICFECQRMVLWSSKDLPDFPDMVSEKEVAKAEQQFLQLEKLFTEFEFPVMKNPYEYNAYFRDNDSNFACKGEMIFDFKETEFFAGATPTISTFKKMVPDDFRFNEETRTAYEFNEKRDSTAIIYSVYSTKQKSEFVFSSNHPDAKLTTATILNPEIKLPNGVSLGMSLEQIQITFNVWDGPAFPSSIIVNYKDAVIRYIFEQQTLRRIEVAIGLE